MTSDSSSANVYSNDGSSMNKVGSYVVQSFCINGKQRALPTLPVFSESKDTVKDTTLKMMSASTGFKYSEKEIMERIDFVMTGSTARNIGVIKEVCEQLEVANENVPKLFSAIYKML